MKTITELKRYQFENGISNKQLSELSGIHETTISLIVNGRLIPSEVQQQRICQALKIELTEIFPEA